MSVPSPFEDRFDRMFGREPDVVQLVARAARKGATFVVGRPKMGKTWTLEEMARRVTNDGALVGYHEATGESPDLLLRAVEDLYTRWLTDASFRAQATSLWARYKDEWVSHAAQAFGRIVEALGGSTIVADKVGEQVRQGLDWLVMANQDLKTGGLQLKPLAYDQARDLLRIVADVSGRPMVLILDAWEKVPEASLKLQRDTLATFLDHLADWPRCHIFTGIRHPEVGGEEAGERAANFANGLKRASPAALVFELQPMHLDAPERSRMLARIVTMVPASATVDATSIEDLVAGYPGVLDRWWFSSDEMAGAADLEKAADDAQALRYTEFDRLLPELSQDERYLVCRLALLPRLDAQGWSRIQTAVLDGLSPALLEKLSHARVLETVRPAPSFGHDTRHEAARTWLMNEPSFEETLAGQAELLVHGLVELFSGINEPSRVPVLMLLALSQRTATLPLAPIPLALLRAGSSLIADHIPPDLEILDEVDWSTVESAAAADLVGSALLNRGAERGQAGDVAGELTDYATVIALPKVSSETAARALVNRAIRKSKSGDVAGELADYTATIESPGVSVDVLARALVNRGRTRGETGDTAGELSDYDTAIALPGAPSDQIARALVNRGVLKGKTGDAAGEWGDFDAAIALRGSVALTARALVNRGTLKARAGDGAGALADFTAAIDLPDAPSDLVAMALVGRGFSRGEAGDRAGELADYDTVIAMPGAPADQITTALVNRGAERKRAGDIAGAIEDLATAIAFPGTPVGTVARALVNRGGARALAGDIAGELADYTAAIDLPAAPAAEVTRALVNRGVTKWEAGNVADAVADYDRAIALRDAPAEWVARALMNRAVTKTRADDIAGALEDVSATIALPGAPPDTLASALVFRGRARAHGGDVAGALADFEACLLLSNAPAEALATSLAWRGLLRGMQGDVKAGRTDLTEALANPALPDALRQHVEQVLASLDPTG